MNSNQNTTQHSSLVEEMPSNIFKVDKSSFPKLCIKTLWLSVHDSKVVLTENCDSGYVSDL